MTARTLAIMSNYALRRPELLDAELDRALKSEAAKITAYYAEARVQAMTARIALTGVLSGRGRRVNAVKVTPTQRRRQSDPVSSSVPP